MSDGTEADAATVSEGYSIISATVVNVFCLLQFIILVIHTVKTVQDLCTKERVSVSHRRSQPKMTQSYKFIAWMGWLSILLSFLSAVGSVSIHFAVSDLHCDLSWTFLLKLQQFSKLCMYWVFIWRLYTIYRETLYRYPKKCILAFGIVFLVWCTFVTILIWVVVSAEVFTYGGPSYPNWCAPGEDVILTAGSIVFLQDFVVAIGFLWAFLRPLRKTIKAVQATADLPSQADKTTAKIIYAGTKTTVITAVGTLSTVVFTVMAIITGIGLFGATDPLVNSVCVALMAPYYPDKSYYTRLCCCCIKCCQKSHGEKEDEKQKQQEVEKTVDLTQSQGTATIVISADTKSVDTMSALRVAGNDAVEMNGEYVDA